MKAVIFSEHGGPEVLRHTEVREPEIGADEVLVRVRACALNHLDLWVRHGLPGITIPMPLYDRNQGNIQRAKLNVTQTQVELSSIERQAIQDMLIETRWNRREAARRLRVSYKALLNKIKQIEIDDSGQNGHLRAQ